jgi:hypothetical protein
MFDRRFTVLIALLSCRTELHTRPVTQAEVREMTEHVEVEGETALQVHTVTDSGSVGTNLKVRDVAERCRLNRATASPQAHGVFDGCLLDDPKFTWEVGTRLRVVNTVAILRGAIALGLVGGLVGGLVYGNVECFAGNCGTGAKVAVGTGDGLIILGIVGVAVYFNAMANYD